MDWLRVVSLVVYTFGAFAYGAIVVVSLARLGRPAWTVGEARAAGACEPNDAVGGTLTTVSFLWFAVNLVMALVGEDSTPNLVWTLFIGTVFLFPPLVMHIVLAESARANPRFAHASWKRPVWLMYAATQAVSVATVLAVYRVVRLPWSGALTGLWIGGFFLVTAIFCSVVLVGGARPQELADQRASRRWMIGLFVFIIVAFLPMTFWQVTRDRLGDVLDLVGRSIPLEFLFVGTYYESRFEFFDLMVKRGLSLLATLALLAAYFGLVAPWLALGPVAWAGPWVQALGLLPLAMALPWIHRRLGGWLDEAWFGRQFTTVEAVKHFLVGLKQATTEAKLVSQARTGIAGIMRAPVSIDARSSPPDPGFESVLDIPNPRDAQGGVIRLGRRRNHRPYFSEDVALVASLGEVFALMLEHVRLQASRQEQDQRARELSLDASRSELKALRAQINPHFLFNALNAIAGLIHEDPARADRAVEQLAEVFRYLLKPVSRARLAKAMERARGAGPTVEDAVARVARDTGYPARFLGRRGARYHVIPAGDVVFFSSEEGQTRLQTAELHYWIRRPRQSRRRARGDAARGRTRRGEARQQHDDRREPPAHARPDAAARRVTSDPSGRSSWLQAGGVGPRP